MNLVIDVGNTRLKYAFFEGNTLLYTGHGEMNMCREIEKKEEGERCLNILASECGVLDEGIRCQLKQVAAFYLEAHTGMALPIGIAYETPQTLGFDRVADCVGAKSMGSDKPLLVIDSGTAITYNYVGEGGVFLGGDISPGQEIRFKALNRFTARLPYVEAEEISDPIGKNTQHAILNGVVNGILFEMKGYIGDFYSRYPEGMVFITGGNSDRYRKHLPENVVFEPDLGLIGLNQILEHNKKDNWKLK